MKEAKPWMRFTRRIPQAVAGLLMVVLISQVALVSLRLQSEPDDKDVKDLLRHSLRDATPEELKAEMGVIEKEIEVMQGMAVPLPLSHLAAFWRRDVFTKLKPPREPHTSTKCNVCGLLFFGRPGQEQCYECEEQLRERECKTCGRLFRSRPGEEECYKCRIETERLQYFDLVLHAIGVSGDREKVAVIEIRPVDKERARIGVPGQQEELARIKIRPGDQRAVRIGCFALREEVTSGYSVTRIDEERQTVQVENPAGGKRYNLGPCRRLFLGGLITTTDGTRAYLKITTSREESSGFFSVNDPLGNAYHLAAIDLEKKEVTVKNKEMGIALTLYLGSKKAQISLP